MEIVVLYLALLAGAFFFFIVRPQRRQLAARRALIASLEVGDEIITAGGIYGTVRELTDTTILVEVAPGTMLTVAREAVSGRPAPAVEPEPAAPPAEIGEPDTDVGESTALGRPETEVDRSAERDLGESTALGRPEAEVDRSAERDLGESS